MLLTKKPKVGLPRLAQAGPLFLDFYSFLLNYFSPFSLFNFPISLRHAFYSVPNPPPFKISCHDVMKIFLSPARRRISCLPHLWIFFLICPILLFVHFHPYVGALLS
ncbi:hypothetical protein F4818DRAFT_433237 [Hypoxylon cercidicola]|nr:hypothetical protein F4818DRAFT_433237 [Hypoxylon cercidicola]